MLTKKIISSLVITIIISTYAMSSSICEHKFVIHGKTEGEYGLLFLDVLRGGECGLKESFIISLEHSKSKVWTRWADYYSNDSSISAMGALKYEEGITLRDSSGKYMISDTAFFTVPIFDSTFQATYRRIAPGGGLGTAKDWKKECLSNYFDLPQFTGVKAELIYTYHGGIYKNYTFSNVVYYPKSNYLVLVTNQPERATGMDTIHGLLIFHLN